MMLPFPVLGDEIIVLVQAEDLLGLAQDLLRGLRQSALSGWLIASMTELLIVLRAI